MESGIAGYSVEEELLFPVHFSIVVKSLFRAADG